MAEVSIRDKTWKEFVALVQGAGRKPEIIVEKVLKEYVQRIKDEVLLADTAALARRAKIQDADIHEIVRQYRRNRARKSVDGLAEAPNAGGD